VPFRVLQEARGKASALTVWSSFQPAEASFPIKTLTRRAGRSMTPDDEKILKLAKEIVVKYIELGRVSPSGFEALFRTVFWALKRTVIDSQADNLHRETFSQLEDSPEES
jgi:hypothetical protein